MTIPSRPRPLPARTHRAGARSRRSLAPPGNPIC